MSESMMSRRGLNLSSSVRALAAIRCIAAWCRPPTLLYTHTCAAVSVGEASLCVSPLPAQAAMRQSDITATLSRRPSSSCCYAHHSAADAVAG